MESWNDNIKRVLTRAAAPVLKMELRGMSTAFLEVRDYSAGAGDSFSIVRNGSTVLTLTEGTHFDAETSNTQTAINIVNAILTVGGFKVSRFGAKLKIRGGGAGTLTMAITSTDEDAWRQYRVGFPNRIVFCSDPRACNGKYGSDIVGMGSSGSSFDIEQRKYQLAAYDITLRSDGRIRDLVTSIPMQGQIAELYIGDKELSESDYELFATSVVMGYQLGDSTVTLNLAEPQVNAADAEVTGHFVAMHPFDIYKWAWQRTYLDSSLWDVASLDSTADDEISHWLVSAHSYHYWSTDKKPPGGFENVKLKDIMHEVEKILPGMVRRDSAGVIEYLPYDPEASTVRHLERKDWESIDYETLDENRYTTVAAVASESELFGDDKNVLFRLSDTQAQALTEADEADDGKPTTLSVESRFFGVPAWILTDASASDTTLEIGQGAISGLSGCRSEDPNFSDAQIVAWSVRPEHQRLASYSIPYPPATQRAGDEADSAASPARLAHYLISDGKNKEIVRVTATAHPAAGMRLWYRPAAFLPPDAGGSTTVDGDVSSSVSVRVTDATVFSMSYPFIRFDMGGGVFAYRNVTAINYSTRILTVHLAITVDDGTDVQPKAPFGLLGSYEVTDSIYNDPVRSVYFPGHIEATVERGQFNLGARAWDNMHASVDGEVALHLTPQVYDLTIAKRICEMQLERFRYGCPIARIVVGLNHGDLQEGDFISFDDPRFLWQEHDGATQTVIWEVIGKRVQPIGDSPRVELTVAWVRSEAIPYATIIDPVWEIPTVSPVYPTPTLELDEPYTDEDGAPYANVEGGWLFPLE